MRERDLAHWCLASENIVGQWHDLYEEQGPRGCLAGETDQQVGPRKKEKWLVGLATGLVSLPDAGSNFGGSWQWA